MRRSKARDLAESTLEASRAFATLVLAAVIAVFVTTLVTQAGVIVADVVNGAPPDKLLEIIHPVGWLLTLFLSIYFGLPGAALFLGIAFWLCVRSAGTRRQFALSGVAAGVVHALIGLGLRLVDVGAGRLGDLEFAALWAGGFFLALSGRPEIAYFLLPASAIGGFLAGAFAGRARPSQ